MDQFVPCFVVNTDSCIRIHSNFRRSVSAQKWQISPVDPGDDTAQCGAISATAGTKLTQ